MQGDFQGHTPVLVEARQVIPAHMLRLDVDAHYVQACCTGHHSTAQLQHILLCHFQQVQQVVAQQSCNKHTLECAATW